jgi:hypothetical protein
MIKIRDFIEKTSNDGNQHIIADLMIDSASELPSQEYAGYVLDMGSIAWDISTGEFYGLDSDGVWHNQSGDDASSAKSLSSSSINSPKSKSLKLDKELGKENTEEADDESIRYPESI